MTNALRLWEGEVLPEWIDANRHMNDGYYAVAFGEASWRVQDRLGLHAEYRARTGGTLYSVEAHLTWDREVALGQRLHIESLVLGVDAKRLRVFHRLFATDEGYSAATMDVMMLHVVHTADGARTTPFPADIAGPLARVAAEHARLGVPAQAGRVVRDIGNRTPRSPGPARG
ncbi:MAG: thioesterase family protein [Thiotrichales bacterium]|nr:thioesterase family protein [Thiotrichales bacterium]